VSDQESDPTMQTETPKGRIDTEVPMELTTGDFESVRPVTSAMPAVEPAPDGGRPAAWLALLIALVLAGAAAWFMVEIYLPLERRLDTQADALRKVQADALELASEIAPLKARIDQLEGEIEELRVAADRDQPKEAASAEPVPAQVPASKPAPGSKRKKKKSR